MVSSGCMFVRQENQYLDLKTNGTKMVGVSRRMNWCVSVAPHLRDSVGLVLELVWPDVHELLQ